MDYKKNPFLMGLWAPAYLAAATVAITNDFLMAVMFMLFTLGILGAYVTEFPIFPTLYQNEILHKTAISSLLGMGPYIKMKSYTRRPYPPSLAWV